MKIERLHSAFKNVFLSFYHTCCVHLENTGLRFRNFYLFHSDHLIIHYILFSALKSFVKAMQQIDSDYFTAIC